MIKTLRRTIGNGVHFFGIQDPKFKTMRITLHFLLPMREKEIASNALLPFLMGRACKDYPDFTQLSQQLDNLYGAGLSSDAGKLGDAQVLSYSVSGISSSYAFDGENMSQALADLLKGILFAPAFENGIFRAEDLRQEKRQLCELIDSEFNDKRIYAKRKCEELLHRGRPCGRNPYGSKLEIERVSSAELRQKWERMLETAQVEILSFGDCNSEEICGLFERAFAEIDRSRFFPCTTERLPLSELQRAEEEQDVAQSKLVMAFRVGIAQPDALLPAAKVMTAVLGGTPASKLFLNVREKMSLCYYCSAQFNSLKGILYVQSGVETQNLSKAEAAILEQLKDMQEGFVTEEEIQAAKLSMCNSLKTVSDSLNALEGWYFSQVYSGSLLTPEEAMEQIQSVTKEQICFAASQVTLDTVYCLKGKESARE